MCKALAIMNKTVKIKTNTAIQRCPISKRRGTSIRGGRRQSDIGALTAVRDSVLKEIAVYMGTDKIATGQGAESRVPFSSRDDLHSLTGTCKSYPELCSTSSTS